MRLKKTTSLLSLTALLATAIVVSPANAEFIDFRDNDVKIVGGWLDNANVFSNSTFTTKTALDGDGIELTIAGTDGLYVRVSNGNGIGMQGDGTGSNNYWLDGQGLSVKSQTTTFTFDTAVVINSLGWHSQSNTTVGIAGYNIGAGDVSLGTQTTATELFDLSAATAGGVTSISITNLFPGPDQAGHADLIGLSSIDYSVVSVPEPGTILMIVCGALGMCVVTLRRRRTTK